MVRHHSEIALKCKIDRFRIEIAWLSICDKVRTIFHRNHHPDRNHLRHHKQLTYECNACCDNGKRAVHMVDLSEEEKWLVI